MKQKNVTLQTIADRAGVSITTVSHVINKTRHVSRETKEAVLKTIDELNYQGVKSRKPGKISQIGVIIADIREDFYVSVTKTIETAASDLGISLIFCDSEDDAEKEARNITMLLERQVSGLILAPIESGHMPDNLRDSKIPTILIDRQYESHNLLFVGINNMYSGYQAARHLHGKGADRIGFVGYSESVYTIKQRILGYKTYLQEMDAPPSPAVLTLSYHREDSYPMIKDFIKKEQLDGIICATSVVCYEVISVLNDLSEKIWKNIKLITYDDNKWFDYLKIPVSVISQPTAEIGNAALENLISLIEQPSGGEGIKRELLFDISLIDRL